MEKSEIEINRYVHTYVEYLLNRLKQIVNEKDRNNIEKLLENNGFNNYSQIQLNRIINDEHSKVNFSIYETLENYRKLYELYEIEGIEESTKATFTYKNLGNNKYLVTYNPLNKYKTTSRLFALNKEKYEFQIEIKDGTNIEEVMPNESELLLALRNSDGHGDNEVLIDEIDEQIIEFACKGNIKEINMNNNDFSNLLANKSKEMYLKSLDTEYGLIKKNYEEESTVESPITNENELDIVLKKFEIAKFKDKVSEIENDEDIINYFDRRNWFYVMTTATYPSWGIQDEGFMDYDKVESFEISEEDKEYINKYINNIEGFYSKNYIEQHAILTQIIKKKYMPSKYYTLENITKKAIKNSTNKIGMNKIFKYSCDVKMFQEDEVKEIVSLIIKAVFLTNKKRFNSISNQIDLNGFENKFVKPNENR